MSVPLQYPIPAHHPPPPPPLSPPLHNSSCQVTAASWEPCNASAWVPLTFRGQPSRLSQVCQIFPPFTHGPRLWSACLLTRLIGILEVCAGNIRRGHLPVFEGRFKFIRVQSPGFQHIRAHQKLQISICLQALGHGDAPAGEEGAQTAFEIGQAAVSQFVPFQKHSVSNTSLAGTAASLWAIRPSSICHRERFRGLEKSDRQNPAILCPYRIFLCLLSPPEGTSGLARHVHVPDEDIAVCSASVAHSAIALILIVHRACIVVLRRWVLYLVANDLGVIPWRLLQELCVLRHLPKQIRLAVQLHSYLQHLIQLNGFLRLNPLIRPWAYVRCLMKLGRIVSKLQSPLKPACLPVESTAQA